MIVAAFPLLRSLGPKPGNTLDVTNWTAGAYLVDSFGRRILASDYATGTVATVFPEGYENTDNGQAVDQTILVHAEPPEGGIKGMSDVPLGFVAYSKLCTHAGCPVGLYERQLNLLVCPCHQSMFDVVDKANVVFGPAPRPLPQLPIAVDAQGYLYAVAGYNQPVGPGFWERSVTAPTRRSPRRRAPAEPYGRLGKAVAELDERLGIAKGGRTFLDKIFPDHWSFMLGEIALYSFVVLLATGVFLTLYYVPSSSPTVCHTPYLPINGTTTSLGLLLDRRALLLGARGAAHAPDAPLGRATSSWARSCCTWRACSSRARSASLASSTGPSGSRCSSSRSSTASSATRCPTT